MSWRGAADEVEAWFSTPKMNGVVCVAHSVDARPGIKRNLNSHGARPVHLIIAMIKWIRTSRLSLKNSFSQSARRKRERKKSTSAQHRASARFPSLSSPATSLAAATICKTAPPQPCTSTPTPCFLQPSHHAHSSHKALPPLQITVTPHYPNRTLLTPISIEFNRFIKLILLEHKPLLACFGFVTSQKWLVSRKISLRKRMNLIDVGAELQPLHPAPCTLQPAPCTPITTRTPRSQHRPNPKPQPLHPAACSLQPALSTLSRGNCQCSVVSKWSWRRQLDFLLGQEAYHVHSSLTALPFEYPPPIHSVKQHTSPTLNLNPHTLHPAHSSLTAPPQP